MKRATKFWVINYSLGHVNPRGLAAVSVQLRFVSHHIPCLQEWFVQVNQRVLKERN